MLKYLLLLAAMGCTKTTGLYQCHTSTTLDYVEAEDTDSADKNFRLAHPEESEYSCSYVDDVNRFSGDKGGNK